MRGFSDGRRRGDGRRSGEIDWPDAGAITGVIRRLKRAGPATARRDPGDRRRVVVRLVAKRLKEGGEWHASFAAAAEQHVYSRYSLRQLDTVADFHQQMTEVLREEIARLAAKPP